MQQNFIIQSWNSWPPKRTDGKKILLLQKTLLESVPKMLKRRLTPLAKTVFCSILSCSHELTNIPVVFSSSHGELGKSLEMMKMIESAEEISPTTFSLSVHNAIAGLFSIAFKNKNQVTVLASSEEGIAPAFIEALGLFQEGEPEVLVVFYDEPLPDFYPYEPFQLTSETPCAVALKLTQKGKGQLIKFQNSPLCGKIGEQPQQLPLLIDFLSTTQQKLEISTHRYSWQWHKYAH